MKRTTFILLLILLFPFNLPAKNINQEKSPYGGTLVWGNCNQPTIISPFFTTQSISASLMDLVFNKLVRWNAQGEIEPDLAESWEVSSDGLVYTFHLRKGVRFHDGVELTSEDVKFTFEKLADPQLNSPFWPSFDIVKEFRAQDKYTFEIVLTKPCPSFIYRLITEIAPKHLLEKEDLRNTPFNYAPVGSGPFKFKEWNKDNQITLEYNPDYYEGRAYLERIIVKIYPDSRELAAALMRQEVDFAYYLEKEDFEVIKNDPVFKTYAIPFENYYAIVYNLQDPLLSDKRIREAIAYAINRKALIKEVASGYGEECLGPFSPGSLGFNPEVKPYEFNPEKSKELLKEAGWQDIDNDGILEKDGEELEIRLLVDSRNALFKKIAMFVRQQLAGVGIKLIVQLYQDESILSKEFLNQKPQARLSDSFFVGGDPAEARYWFSEGVAQFSNLWKYDNFELFRYLKLGATTLDKTKRKWIYQEIHRFIYADQPVCFLYFPYAFCAVSDKFKNTDELFNSSMPIYSLKNWIAKDRSEPEKRKEVRKWR